MADIFEISGRIHSTSQEEVVTTSSEILDEEQNKKQSEVNADVDTALADRYTKEETYSKSQLDNLITTPDVAYETYRATDETSIDDILPSEGAADTIYRIGNWDGSAVDAGKYSEYAWNGSAYQLLAVRSGSLDGVYDISANNLTEGQPTQYDDLESALGMNGANVPIGERAGGMQVRFINFSTGKYEQWRYMDKDIVTVDTFINVANWQGVDEEPIVGSKNLVTSGGVYNIEHDLESIIGGNIINNIPIQTTGKVIIASTGAISDNEWATGITDYIPVTPGTIITIVNGVRQQANLGYAYCAFYSNNTGESGTFISSLVNSTAAVEIINTEIKVPDGAAYMLLYLESVDKDAKIIYGKNVLSSIDELKQKEGATEGLINKLVDYSVGGNYTKDDYTLKNRIYSNSGAETAYNSDTDSMPLLKVVGGQRIYWHNWKQGSDTIGAIAAIYCYDSEGLPFNGVNARIDYSGLTEHDYQTGEYSFIIPTNCSYIGLSTNFNAYFPESGTSNIVLEETCSLTETSKELINDSIDVSGGDSMKYYLKGNSNIIFSPIKKLGIIAAGQSNIDGRNAYDDYPYKSVNPNTKVHFKKSLTQFTAFSVPNQAYSWAFDAIVYNLLTDSNYGEQTDIYVMKKSMGGTSIDPEGAGGGTGLNYHWTPDYEFLPTANDSLLRSFESIIRGGVDEQGKNFDIKAMLWHQGEADSHNEQVAKRYYENLKNTFAYIRGVVDNPRLHIFCGTVSERRSNPEFISVINAAYWRLASEDPYLHVVDMTNAQPQSDGIHFNYEWSIYFGQMVYDMMIDAGIITGTKVNPTPPTNS